MKFGIFLISIMLMSCIGGEHIPEYSLYDEVRFNYTGENRFFVKQCEDTGKIVDFSYFSSTGMRYLLAVKCDGKTVIPEIIWVKEADITEVIKIAE